MKKKNKFKSNSDTPIKTVKYWWELEGEDLDRFIQKSRWDLKQEDKEYREEK